MSGIVSPIRIALISLLTAGAWAAQPASHPEEPAPGADHWAYQPIQRPAPPNVRQTAWPRTPVDAFILARLEAANLTPSPEADRRTLARRLHLDLLGLLPEPETVEAFVQDRSPDAYARLVDRLLASPHFGERWGRHWLDLARYADSDGYLGDNLRDYAWLYRDWVINAINADLPFDRFTVAQLAGDLLPQARLDQQTAAGFHRNTLKNTEAGADRELNRTKEVVDRVNTTGTVWLGLTVGCAECHDHKHDAVSQREYYRLFDFFNNAEETAVPAPLPGETAAYQRALAAWKANPDRDEKKKPKPPPTKAPSFSERTKDRRSTHIHIRGDYARPGDAVTAGTPSVLPILQPTSATPSRLDLARWLVHPDHPLTARVTVNRVWQRLFGVGIVPTSDDFGTKGAPPTHPLLLDWLAAELQHNGWRRKELIRTLVNSAAYRQSSVMRPELADHPLGNTLLWRQNSVRLDAESIRDIHLAASGLLDPRVGGPGIHPPLPEFVTEVGRSVKWPVSKGGDRYRRGLYIFFKRTVPYPMLIAFDAPDSSASCSRRERSNSPLQALTLLNDPVFFECAEVLGRRLQQRHGNDTRAALQEMFQRCLGRNPGDRERQTLLQAHADLQSRSARDEGGDTVPPLVAVARIVLNLDEFITRD